MAEHSVWISIQSDFGITLGEIGQLPSNTDSKLIASTLMTLKDIVATEAISASSNFMEGQIESGAFGVLALKVTDTFSIIMSYFVSNPVGPIDPNIKTYTQELALNLGQQLMQIADLPKLAEIGAQIPFPSLTKAYLNSCEIARMRIALPNNKKPLLQGFEAKLMEIINNRKDLVELIDELFGTKGWKIATYNWNNGFLVRERREEVLESLSLYILGLLARDDPLMILMVDQKQNIISEFVRYLKSVLRKRITTAHLPVVKALPKAMEGNVTESYSKIYLRFLHDGIDNLFSQFARKAILAAMKDDASIIFVNIDPKPIKKKFQELLPDLSINHAGYFYIQSISPFVTERAKKYVEAFYNGYFEPMKGIPLSQASWEILTSFAYEFVDQESLVKGFNQIKDTSVNERWKKELLKWSNVRKLTQLKVENINEAVAIANSASNAITRTLAQILLEQFLYDADGKLGLLVQYYINLYFNLGPSIKSTAVMLDIFDLLVDTEFGIDFLIPNPQDFIIAGLDRGRINLEKDDKTISYDKKTGITVNGESFPINEFLLTNSDFVINSENGMLQQGGGVVSANLFIFLIREEDTYVKAIEEASMRRISEHIIKPVIDISNSITSSLLEIQNYIKKKSKEPTKNLRAFNLNQYVSGIQTLPDYGDFVNKKLLEMKTLIDPSLGLLKTFWDDFILKTSGNAPIPSDYFKPLDKQIKAIIKSLQKTQKDIEKLGKSLGSDVAKFAKTLKRDIKRAFHNTEDQILNYDTTSTHLFEPLELVSDRIHKYIETSSVLNQSARDQLAVGIALEIFENPTDIVLNPSYNEIIQNDLSKHVKDVLNQASDKKDFERLLVEKSYEIVDKMYDSLRRIFVLAENTFMGRNAPISVEGSKIFLKMGNLSVNQFRNKEIIKEGLSFPGIKIAREASTWSITYEFPEIPDISNEEPSLVTLGDAVRYLTTIRIKEDIKKIISGLETIAEVIEPNAGDRLNNLVDKLYGVIYSKLIQ